MSPWPETLTQLRAVLEASEALAPTIDRAVKRMRSALDRGGIIFTCGNGGSHAHAAHLTAELVVRYRHTRPAFASLALGCNSAVLTATVNDLQPVELFERELGALAGPNDLIFAISTSGKSPNVLRAVSAARERGLDTVALTGGDGLATPVGVEIRVPSTQTARIQELHTMIIHSICEALDA
jgi:phosphoheptose isomerase